MLLNDASVWESIKQTMLKTPLYPIPERMNFDSSLTFLIGFLILISLHPYVHLVPDFILPSVYLRILAYLQPKKLWDVLSNQLIIVISGKSIPSPPFWAV